MYHARTAEVMYCMDKLKAKDTIPAFASVTNLICSPSLWMMLPRSIHEPVLRPPSLSSPPPPLQLWWLLPHYQFPTPRVPFSSPPVRNSSTAHSSSKLASSHPRSFSGSLSCTYYAYWHNRFGCTAGRRDSPTCSISPPVPGSLCGTLCVRYLSFRIPKTHFSAKWQHCYHIT
jgi:hypothetical protein